MWVLPAIGLPTVSLVRVRLVRACVLICGRKDQPDPPVRRSAAGLWAAGRADCSPKYALTCVLNELGLVVQGCGAVDMPDCCRDRSASGLCHSRV